MNYQGFTFEKTGNVGTLTFNNPKTLNAITAKMSQVDLPSIFREIQLDDNVRVLVITGAGRAFSSGGNVVERATGANMDLELKLSERLQVMGGFLLPLYNLDKPVIAAINGVAAGGGLSVALLSDIRIASENAKFIMSFVKRGLIPDFGATFILPRLIGPAKAFELAYTGADIEAEEAKKIGLVNKVVESSQLMDEVMCLATKLAEGPPLALGQTRRAFHNGMVNSLEQQLILETYAQNHLFTTEDFLEGAKSFLEKRKPIFRGK